MKHLLEFAEYRPIRPHEKSIGILADTGRTSKFGEQTLYFKRLVQEARAHDLDCFVFTDFDDSGTVAWTLDGDQWVRAHRGLPQVFYDRSFHKKLGAGDKSNTRALSEMGCTPINSADFRKLALDKYQTYEEVIAEKPSIFRVPTTEKFSAKGIIPFLDRFSSCIIKPRFGSGGKGIIKVSKADELYEVRYLKQAMTVTSDRLLESIDSARQQMRSSKRAYIIQECVDIPMFENSVFDVRVIYQRGSDGKPLRTGMAVRLASPSRITANLHKGGSRHSLSEVLQHVFGQDLNGEIAESIRLCAKQIFEKLDARVGPIGETGMDFLIDRSGRVHLIEVNSLPGRSLFTILPKIRERSIKRPIEYAKYLLNKKAA